MNIKLKMQWLMTSWLLSPLFFALVMSAYKLLWILLYSSNKFSINKPLAVLAFGFGELLILSSSCLVPPITLFILIERLKSKVTNGKVNSLVLLTLLCAISSAVSYIYFSWVWHQKSYMFVFLPLTLGSTFLFFTKKSKRVMCT